MVQESLNSRARLYALLIMGFAATGLIVARLAWEGSTELHTLMEVVATF